MEKKTIGKNIRCLRKASNMTQADLAAILMVRHEVVCHWETGRYKPSAQNLSLLGKALNVPASYFLETNFLETKKVEMDIEDVKKAHAFLKEYAMTLRVMSDIPSIDVSTDRRVNLAGLLEKLRKEIK